MSVRYVRYESNSFRTGYRVRARSLVFGSRGGIDGLPNKAAERLKLSREWPPFGIITSHDSAAIIKGRQ